MAAVLADYAEVCCASHAGKAEVQLSKLIREKVQFDRYSTFIQVQQIWVRGLKLGSGPASSAAAIVVRSKMQ